jgi:hypothetical protein
MQKELVELLKAKLGKSFNTLRRRIEDNEGKMISENMLVYRKSGKNKYYYLSGDIENED